MWKTATVGSCFAACVLIMAGVAFAQSSRFDLKEARVQGRAQVSILSRLGKAPAPVVDLTRAVRSCEDLSALRLATSAIVREAQVVRGQEGEPDWCRVKVEVAQLPAPNITTIWIGLPLKNWNGRFLGLGGGGFQGGLPGGLGAATALGFSAAATDAGHGLESPEGGFSRAEDGSFVLDSDGQIDWIAVRSYAYVGIHDMTVVGKALTWEFYGVAPRYAYFSGCSGGGRQGQSEVQRYPEDYDGVLSGAPAISIARFVPAGMWPQVVMNELQPVPQCKLEVARRGAIEACDAEDGVRDGLISQLNKCSFDPASLVGRQTACGVIDAQDAEVMRQIWDGPRRQDGSRLWYGLDHSATFETARTSGTPLQGQPWRLADSWFRHFLTRNPNWTAHTLSASTFELLFDQSVDEYGDVLDTSRSDIGAFGNRGGRTIIWHGLADPVIPAAGSVQYVDSIRKKLGPGRTDQFLRFYLAPGVAHCAGGDGPQPVGLLEALMNWVEHSDAPGPMLAENRNENGKVVRTRPLCPYPQRALYRGRGSIDDAASFTCRR